MTLSPSRTSSDRPPPSSVARELAPAKVNLTLRVLGRRPDGYHALESLVVFADMGDTVDLDPHGVQGLEVTGPRAGAIDGPNLLDGVLGRLAAYTPGRNPGRVRLDKHLPVAAGLGGGSADAAALVRAWRRLNPDRLDDASAHTLAAALGADVPVCLAGRAALIWGKGERITPVPGLPTLAAVLVNPGVPLRTPDVFRALAAAPLAGPEPMPAAPGPVTSTGALIDWIAAIGNDLQAPAVRLCPPIAEVLAALRGGKGCLYAAQSGSGPSCFGLFVNDAEAAAAAADLSARAPRWWVAATRLR